MNAITINHNLTWSEAVAQYDATRAARLRGECDWHKQRESLTVLDYLMTKRG